MAHLVEFKVSRSLFDNVKNDLEFRMGFEAEFHVRYAADLLKDLTGNLPTDFTSFNPSDEDNSYQGAFADYSQVDNAEQPDEDQLDYYKDTVLDRLCRLFEQHLGLQNGSIGISTPHTATGIESYRKWQLALDASLEAGNQSQDEDLGVELISPVMTLREGLVWVNRIFEMIGGFQHGEMSLYTSGACGFHINLSHLRMGNDFDFAKLAILSGDAHYLEDFKRISNKYAQPLLQTVQKELTASQDPNPLEPPPHQENALALLNLRGWSPQRVMSDLAAMIPKEHHMSVDFRRLDTLNPYIEIRIAGNAGYEQRFDEIAGLAIRFAALIKIACDPTAQRTEYLKKIYQLVSGVTAAQPAVSQTTFPKLRIYLRPIMNQAVRQAIDVLEQQARTGAFTNTPFMFLRIVRAATNGFGQDLRIRQGLLLLLGALKFPVADLQTALKNFQMLKGYGVIGPADKQPGQVIKVLSEFVKWLDAPAGRMPVLRTMQQEAAPEKPKPQLSEYERRRLEEKRKKLLAEEERQLLLRKRHRELQEKKQKQAPKTFTRYVA